MDAPGLHMRFVNLHQLALQITRIFLLMTVQYEKPWLNRQISPWFLIKAIVLGLRYSLSITTLTSTVVKNKSIFSRFPHPKH